MDILVIMYVLSAAKWGASSNLEPPLGLVRIGVESADSDPGWLWAMLVVQMSLPS